MLTQSKVGLLAFVRTGFLGRTAFVQRRPFRSGRQHQLRELLRQPDSNWRQTRASRPPLYQLSYDDVYLWRAYVAVYPECHRFNF